MRHIGKLAGAALIVLLPTAGFAQMGAPAGAPMQPGGWGQGGWQAGAPGAGYTSGQQGYAGPQQHGDWHRGPMEHGHGDYKHLERGKRLPRAYADPSYTVVDWSDWGFSPPGPGMRWVRYYDDGMLIDGDGRIVDARYGVDWDRGHMRGPRGGFGPRGGYPGGPGGFGPGGPGYGYPAPGVTTFRAGPNTTVTTAVVQAPPPVIVGGPGYGYGGGYGGGYYAGGASVISVTPGVAVTTTTTTTDYETVYKSVGVRRAWKRPIRHYHPRCARAPTCAVQGS